MLKLELESWFSVDAESVFRLQSVVLEPIEIEFLPSNGVIGANVIGYLRVVGVSLLSHFIVGF
jgi:hypothetical protein